MSDIDATTPPPTASALRDRTHVDGLRSDKGDARLVEQFGYEPQLHRTMGKFSTFAISFSLISLTTGIFANYAFGLQSAGPRFIWTWVIVGVGNMLIALSLAHMSTRVPLAGYAYQWAARMVSRRYGWFPGWLALVGWLTGTPGVAYAFSQYFAPYVGLGSSTSTIVLVTVVVLLSWMTINLVGMKVASSINNFSVATEMLGILAVGVGLLIYSIVHGTNSAALLTHHGPSVSTIGFGAFATSSLMAAYCLTGYEGAADLAEESHDPRRSVPRAIILSMVISGVAGFVVLLGFTLAIPNQATIANSATPLLTIAQHYLHSFTPVFMTTVFIAIYACGLINLAALTRLAFSISRDSLLPWSGGLRRVSKAGSPYIAIVIGTVISILFTLVARVEAVITSVSSVAIYGSYMLIIVAGLCYRGEEVGKGYFSLRGWFAPIAYVSVAWIIVLLVALIVAPGNSTILWSTITTLALGVLWYFVRVRRLPQGTPDPGRVPQARTPEGPD